MLKLLEKLRPEGETAAALAEALDRTAAALTEAEGRLADLQGQRGAALLAGGKEAERHEAALREAREDAERLAALADALRQRHAEAEKREGRAKLEAQAAEAARAAKAAGQAIARDYPKVAGQLVALLRAEREALAALDALTGELGRAPIEAAEGITLPPPPRAFYGPPSAAAPLPLADAVRLPRHDSADLGWPSGARLWPPSAS